MNATKDVTLVIPDLKTIKDNKKRRSRGGGLPWLPVIPSGTGLTIGALMGCKLGVLLLLSAITATAVGYGRARAPEYARYKMQQRTKAAAKAVKGAPIKYEGDLSGLASPDKYGDSLGMVTGGIGKGSWGVEKKGSPLLQAEIDAAKNARDSGEPPADEIPQVADIDAAALAGGSDEAAAAAGDAARKFGELSKTVGAQSQLAGGSGFSGGFSRSFDPPKFNDGKSGGAGLGNTTALRHDKKVGRLASRMPRSSTQGGSARRQLVKANRFSNLARGGPNETRSVLSNQAFENSAGGSSIEGAGASMGERVKDPAGSEAPTAPNTGGPTSAADGLIACADGSRAAVCPASEEGESIDETDAMITAAKVIVAVIAIWLIAQAIAKLMDWTVVVEAMVAANMAVLITLGLALTAIGIALMAMGRPVQGGIYTAMGALTAALAYFGDPAGPAPLVLIGQGILTAVMPMLADRMDPKSKGDWD